MVEIRCWNPDFGHTCFHFSQQFPWTKNCNPWFAGSVGSAETWSGTWTWIGPCLWQLAAAIKFSQRWWTNVNDGCSRFESPQGWDVHTVYYYIYHLSIYSLIYSIYIVSTSRLWLGAVELHSWFHWIYHLCLQLIPPIPRPRRHESGKLKMNRQNWCRVLRESMGIPMNPRSFQDLQWMGVDGVLLGLVPVDDPSLHLLVWKSLGFPWSNFQGLAPTPHNESLERDRLVWCIRPGELGLVTRRYDMVWRRLGINNP